MEDLKLHQTASPYFTMLHERAGISIYFKIFQVWWGSEAMQVDVEALPGCEAAEPWNAIEMPKRTTWFERHIPTIYNLLNIVYYTVIYRAIFYIYIINLYKFAVAY